MLKKNIEVLIGIQAIAVLFGPLPKEMLAHFSKKSRPQDGVFPFTLMFPSSEGGGIDFMPKIVESKIAISRNSTIGVMSSKLSGRLVSLDNRTFKKLGDRYLGPQVCIKYLAGTREEKTVGEIVFDRPIDECIGIHASRRIQIAA